MRSSLSVSSGFIWSRQTKFKPSQPNCKVSQCFGRFRWNLKCNGQLIEKTGFKRMKTRLSAWLEQLRAVRFSPASVINLMFYCFQVPFKRFSFSSHDNRHAFQDEGEYFGNVSQPWIFYSKSKAVKWAALSVETSPSSFRPKKIGDVSVQAAPSDAGLATTRCMCRS